MSYQLHTGHYSVLRYLGCGWQEGRPTARPRAIHGIHKKWIPHLKRHGLVSWDGTRGQLTASGMAVLATHRKERA